MLKFCLPKPYIVPKNPVRNYVASIAISELCTLLIIKWGSRLGLWYRVEPWLHDEESRNTSNWLKIQ